MEEIKNRLEVADVVGSYVQLKQSGRNLKAPCPFHHEKTASFMVSPEKGIWHCFGCGEGGDIFKFVMKIEGLDFRGALEMLAKRAGVELKNVKADGGGQAKLKKRLIEAHEWAIKYFQANLLRNKKALDYVVHTRRLGKQIITDFQIGYAPESWDGLAKALRAKGFSEAELVQAGLAGSRTNGRGIFDQFRGRVMFTIADATGQPIGFTGRVLGDELPKYLNTPQTILYDKSRAIFGFHLAKESMRKNDRAVLVEGNVDVISSHQIGVKEVVAASGTALTLEQLKAISYLTKNILLAFDADRAGLAAAERAIPLAQKLGLNLFIVDMGEAKDPDELITMDPKAWKDALDSAKELRQYWLDRSIEQFNIKNNPSGIEKVRFIEQMAGILRLYDNTTQAVFISDIASATGIEIETMQAALNEKPKASTLKSPVKQAVQKIKRPPKIAGRPMLEDAILGLNLAYPEARLSMEDLDPADFEGEQAQAVVAYIQGDGHDMAALDIAKHLPDLSDYVKILTLRGEEQYGSFAPADRSFEAFMLTRRLQTIGTNLTKHQLTAELQAAEAAGDTKLVKTLLAKYQALISEE